SAAAPAVQASDSTMPAPAASRTPGLAFEIGGVLWGVISQGGTTGDAGIELAIGRRNAALALRLGFFSSATREVALGSGNAHWSRVRGLAGLRGRMVRGPWFADLFGDFVA